MSGGGLPRRANSVPRGAAQRRQPRAWADPASGAWLLAAVAGAGAVPGFAPFAVPALPLLALAVLFVLWNATARPRAAAVLGFAFGIGLFGAGASWVYVALSGFGEMAPPLAALATLVWVAYLALWPALAGWIAVRITAPASVLRLVACVGAWTAAEWLRSHGYTGFPWLVLGYAQWPGSPLAGFGPLGGVFLLTLTVAGVAGCLACIVDSLARVRRRAVLGSVALIAAFAAVGAALLHVDWTRPSGAPLTVSLVQGNIGQDVKFDPGFRQHTFAIYRDLVAQSRGRLVVLPESAFPMFADQVPEPVFLDLVHAAHERDGLVLLGLFTAQPPLPGSSYPRYYNTVAAIGGGGVELYRKRHLVPFGESIPLKSVLGPVIDRVLAIPLADQTSGGENQPPFRIAGHAIAVNICYEDAFGSELIGAARQADILVNVTNDAWYGHSIAAWQHNQIAAMRALELGRPMLRATNTGITSAIDARGRERAHLPWFSRGVLELEVQGRTGLTPYARVGDLPALSLAVALIAWPAIASRRSRRAPAPVTGMP